MKPLTGTPLVYGTPETGLWCDTCLFPSHAEIPVYVIGDDGPIKIGFISSGCGCFGKVGHR